jgi:hypothetical protein
MKHVVTRYKTLYHFELNKRLFKEILFILNIFFFQDITIQVTEINFHVINQ